MMNKNNNLIQKGAILSTFLFLSVFLGGANKAEAYLIKGYYEIPAESEVTYSDSSSSVNSTPAVYNLSLNKAPQYSDVQTISITGKNFTKNTIAKFDNENRDTTFIDSNHILMKLQPKDLMQKGKHIITVYDRGAGTYSNGATFTVGEPSGTYSGNAVNTGSSNANDYNSSTSSNYNSTYTNSNLSSNVYSSGVNAFLPQTFLQWLMVAILIFLIVILWRKLYLTEEERNKPLVKHL